MLDTNDFEASHPEAHADHYRTERLESLSAGLQRLCHWVHKSSWRLWATERLTPTQLKILQLLTDRGEGLTITALARELCMSPATVCDSVRALKDKGLLAEERSTQDARKKLLRQTAAGKKTSRRTSLSEQLFQAFSGLTPAEQQSWNMLSTKMIHNLEDQGELPKSRTCVRCQFFRPNFSPGSDAPHFCDQRQRSLRESAMPSDCPVFAAADAATQSAVWEAFTAESGPAMSSKPFFEDRRGNHAAPVLQHGGQ